MTNGKRVFSRDVQIAVVVTALLLLAVLGFEVYSGDATNNDFNSIYIAAWIMRHADPALLYDFQQQITAEREVFNVSGLLPVIHPPFEALFAMPFAWMSYIKAYFLWGLIDISLWLWFCYIVRPYVPVPAQALRYLMLCFAFLPIWVAFLQGQTSILLLSLYSLVYLSLKSGRDFRAGLFLGAGLFRFQLVIPFALITVIRRKWAMLGGLITMGFILAALSFAAVGAAGIRSYIDLLAGIAGDPSHPYNSIVPAFHMMSINSFLQVVAGSRLSPAWIAGLSTIAALSLVLLVGWSWRRLDVRADGRSFEMLFAAALAVSIVTGFHSLYHDLSLMLLAILLVLGCPAVSSNGRWKAALNASIALLFIIPMAAIGVQGLHMYVTCPILIAFAIAAVQLSERWRESLSEKT